MTTPEAHHGVVSHGPEASSSDVRCHFTTTAHAKHNRSTHDEKGKVRWAEYHFDQRDIPSCIHSVGTTYS